MALGSKNNRQHFVPQAYLKRFTSTGDKDCKLFVYDLLRDRSFGASPKNVAHKNKFYRLEDLYPNLEPDFVDKFLDSNIQYLERVIFHVIQNKKVPEAGDDSFDNLYGQMGLLMARNPESRETLEIMYEVTIKEHMKTQIGSAPPILKKEVEKKGIYQAIKVEFNQDKFIADILQSAKTYAKCLQNRFWAVLEAPSGHHFVTSDLPISSARTDNKFHRYGAGLDDHNTRVFFPVSKDFGLLGEFDPYLPTYHRLSIEELAALNSHVIQRPYSQIYSPIDDFIWLMNDGKIGNLHDFIDWRKSRKVQQMFKNYHSLKRQSRMREIKNYFLDNFDPETMLKKRNSV